MGLGFLAESKIRLNAVDWSLLIIVSFEMISLAFSSYRANSIGTLRAIILALLVFFAVRLTLPASLQILSCAGVFGLGGAWLGLNGLRQFSTEAGRLADAGLSDLLAFRSHLFAPPAPWLPGEWFTLLLLALPFACAVPLYLWQRGKHWPAVASVLPALIITATLTLSLSRAVFWSVVLFFFSSCLLLVASRLVTLRVGGLIFSVILASLPLTVSLESLTYPGLSTAYCGYHTSQNRSTQGRLEIWNRSLEIVQHHALIGAGSGNSALMLLSSADDEETTGFASRTFSLPVQILLEKGITGFFVYGAFLALMAREFVRTMRQSGSIRDPTGRNDKPASLVTNSKTNTAAHLARDDPAYRAMVCCFGAGLIAVLFRELTYSSLMEHSLTMVLVAALAAMICVPKAAPNHR